jgi:2-hydroxychromene-2-carboxylate isomerase
MTVVKFYFDFLSPYAWLAWRPLLQLVHKYQSPSLSFQPIPILFAGLLNAHGQLGPAEIPSKRIWLMKDVLHRAKIQNLQVNPPPTHPFNPLLSLRTVTAMMERRSSSPSSSSDKIQLIGQLFDAVWMDGKDVSDVLVVEEILREKMNYSSEDIEYLLREASGLSVKERLREATAEAISRHGVFGVPTTLVNEELFWGSESETIQMVEKAIQREQGLVMGTEAGADEREAAILQRWSTMKKSADRREKRR